MAENETKTDGLTEDAVVFFGSAVKSLGGGRVGGYLITFGGEDLDGDTFTAATDFGPHKETPVLYHHGYDDKLGLKSIGTGHLTVDDVGVWIDAQLDMADEYVKLLLERGIEAGKMGWSSGTSPHLVKRAFIDGRKTITRWPLGLDASITPMPAEPRNHAVTLKSLLADEANTSEAVETATEAPKCEEAQTQPESESKEVNTMPENTFSLDDVKKMIDEAVKSQGGLPEIVATKAAPAVNTNPQPDTTKAAFFRYMRTGDVGAANEVNRAVKEANPWVEGTAADGGILVPEDFYPRIIEKRDPYSIIRRAPGAMIIPTSRSSIQVPVQGDRMPIFTLTSEGSDSNDSEIAPFTDLSITIYDHRRTVQIHQNLISDSALPVENYLAGLFGRAAALTENNYVVAGTGSSQPQGILYGGTAGLTLDSASAIGAAEIPELYHKLKSEYEDGAVWVLRNATMGYLRGLTSSSVFTFAPTPTAGPDLYGKPYFLTDYAGAITASAKSLCVGNFAYMAFAENWGMRIFRDPYTHSKGGYVDYHATIRFGCAVAQAEAFQYATHPTA